MHMGVGVFRIQQEAVDMEVYLPVDARGEQWAWECRCLQRAEGGSVHVSAGFSCRYFGRGQVSAGVCRGQRVAVHT